jgi:hypothetical protein
MPPYAVRLVGDPRFPRYVIRDRSRPGDWYWTGAGWSRRLRKALLFADAEEANRAIAKLYAELIR